MVHQYLHMTNDCSHKYHLQVHVVYHRDAAITIYLIHGYSRLEYIIIMEESEHETFAG